MFIDMKTVKTIRKNSKNIQSTYPVDWINLRNILDEYKDIDGNMTHALLLAPAFTLFKDDTEQCENIYVEILDYTDRHRLYWNIVNWKCIDDILTYYGRYFRVFISWDMPYNYL